MTAEEKINKIIDIYEDDVNYKGVDDAFWAIIDLLKDDMKEM